VQADLPKVAAGGMPDRMREHESESDTATATEPPSPAVVRVLVDNHRQFLAFLERRVGSRALAEDILQEAFAQGLDKVDHLRSEESAIAWFYRLLRNAVIDSHRRRASAHRGIEAFAAELETQEQPNTDVRNAVCQCVSELAGTLKSEYASALKRIEVDGIAVKDYALEAGISCGTCADHGCLDCTCDTAKRGCGESDPR
jgi:RNA polymerase sigma-70 factor (ECF subfamily)